MCYNAGPSGPKSASGKPPTGPLGPARAATKRPVLKGRAAERPPLRGRAAAKGPALQSKAAADSLDESSSAAEFESQPQLTDLPKHGKPEHNAESHGAASPPQVQYQKLVTCLLHALCPDTKVFSDSVVHVKSSSKSGLA